MGDQPTFTGIGQWDIIFFSAFVYKILSFWYFMNIEVSINQSTIALSIPATLQINHRDETKQDD